MQIKSDRLDKKEADAVQGEPLGIVLFERNSHDNTVGSCVLMKVIIAELPGWKKKMNEKLAELGSKPLSTSPAVILRPLSLFEFLVLAKLTLMILDDQYHEADAGKSGRVKTQITNR